MTRTKRPRHLLTAISAATVLLGLAAQAVAAPVLGAGSTAQAPVGSPSIPFTSSAPGFEYSSSNNVQAAGTASANSFANSNGAYAVRSTAGGNASSSAHAQLLYTLTNATALAQSYTMGFHIYGGSISTSLSSGATLAGGESLLAQYAASIKVGGTSVFSSASSLTRTAAGLVLAKSGTDFGADDISDSVYSWGAHDYLIDLGILAAGQSVAVLAEVDDASTAAVGTYSFGGGGGYGCYGGGYGGYGGVSRGDLSSTPQSNAVAAPMCFKGTASAFYGDPVDFFGIPTAGANDPPITFIGNAVNDVPEPASLALVAVAMLGAGAAGRRQTRRAWRKPAAVHRQEH